MTPKQLLLSACVLIILGAVNLYLGFTLNTAGSERESFCAVVGLYIGAILFTFGLCQLALWWHQRR